MASLFLSKNPESSREALARELNQKLAENGIHYHLRTLKRQLQGSVSSVPPEAEKTMRRILIGTDGLKSAADIESALSNTGNEVTPGERLPTYISSDRLLPLAQLWLHLNPGKSKRFLACRLGQDFRLEGICLNVDSIQTILARKHRLARREICECLLMYLAEMGVGSESDARVRYRREAEEIGRSIHGRQFVDAQRFLQLCRLWQLRHGVASSRRFALLLQQRLSKQGISISLHNLQHLVSGRRLRVRCRILAAAEELLQEEFHEGKDLEKEIVKIPLDSARIADLCWVRAKPITALAREWLLRHPGISMRQLAMRVDRTIRRMGYCCSHNTIQPILGGWKKKTRGFVYRAMLKQFERRTQARIPEKDRIGNPRQWQEQRYPKPSLQEFLQEARRYLPMARSPHFLPFVTFRAERLYGIPRHEAEARIAGGKPPSHACAVGRGGIQRQSRSHAPRYI